MATVNLFPHYGLSALPFSPNLSFNVMSTYINFHAQPTLITTDDVMKVIMPIDLSKYTTITFQYSSIHLGNGIFLRFGIFDTVVPNDTGTILIDYNEWKTAGDSVTVNVSGMSNGFSQYIGFIFGGNTCDLIGKEVNTLNTNIYNVSISGTEREYTLTYNANGGSGAPGSVNNILSTTISSIVPTRSGYDFLGWSTSSSATSASYVAGDTISISEDTTLYAVWRAFYTVTYDANGGSDAPLSQKKIYGEILTLTTDEPTPPSKQYYTHTISLNANGGFCDTDFIDVVAVEEFSFGYWFTYLNGYRDIYYPGDTYEYNSDVTFSAAYLRTYYHGTTTLPIPTRANYDFLGWATDPYAASGMTGVYNTDADVTLYAIWKPMGNVYIHDGEFSTYKVLIKDRSGWNQYIPYIYTESGWEMYSG